MVIGAPSVRISRGIHRHTLVTRVGESPQSNRHASLPFALPARPKVRRLREESAKHATMRTQQMAGFEDRFTDIVDYIVRITDEIWIDRAVGYIYNTYDPSCVIYSSYGVVRSVEDVIAGTLSTLNAFPDGSIEHLNVAWSGDDQDGFYTSHLGHSRSVNLGQSSFGPGTGRRTSIRFAADCVSYNNRIHTEWLVRDNGAAVRQLGFDRHEVAQALAATETPEQVIVAPRQRDSGRSSPQSSQAEPSTISDWACSLYHHLFAERRLDRVDRYYADEAVIHASGGRIAKGPRDIQTLFIHLLSAIVDSDFRVDNVCHSDESDGVIVAVRWVLEGRTAPGGFLGQCPAGRPVRMMGISHLRLVGPKVVEEWMLFDEIGVLVQAYRQ